MLVNGGKDQKDKNKSDINAFKGPKSRQKLSCKINDQDLQAKSFMIYNKIYN